MRNKGFTLIELMVVVLIMGILMAAGIIAFNNARVTSRDSKRKTDVDAISKAEEQYFQQNSWKYPLAANISTGIASYFPNAILPVDPQNTGTYVYTLTASAANPNLAFCICAKLEKTTAGNATSAGAAGVCSYTATGTGGAFQCASQRQ